jgi:hypothetical protein
MEFTELQKLEQRVADIEEALAEQDIFKRKHRKGEDIINALWVDAAKGFNVSVEFECEACGQYHAATVFVKQGSKDGNLYEFKGTCGATSALRLWKDVNNKRLSESIEP